MGGGAAIVFIYSKATLQDIRFMAQIIGRGKKIVAVFHRIDYQAAVRHLCRNLLEFVYHILIADGIGRKERYLFLCLSHQTAELIKDFRLFGHHIWIIVQQRDAIGRYGAPHKIIILK